jgi:DNA segregation ATPase FtsK/SpoIIIE, S-DNA-T family
MTTKPPTSTPDPDDFRLATVLNFPIKAGDVIGAEPDEDRESVTIDQPATGVPVDPPDEPRPAKHNQTRRPIAPGWLRSKRDAVAALRWMLDQAGYAMAFHGLRLPKYAGKTAMYAPVGAVRMLSRLLRWATAEDGNYALRQAAANRDDPSTWLRLDMQRQRQARWRWTLLALAVLAAVILVAIGSAAVPVPLVWLAAVVAVVLLARAGRPGDKPITDRVTDAKAYRKLTAELVRQPPFAS